MYAYLKGFVHATVLAITVSTAFGYYEEKQNNDELKAQIRKLRNDARLGRSI